MLVVGEQENNVGQLLTVLVLLFMAEIKAENKALIESNQEVPGHMKLPSLSEILKLRQTPTRNGNNNRAFTFIVEHLAGAVIGQRRWKLTRCYKPLSECMTVSDEAFMLLVLENNYELWQDADTNRVGRGKYTENAPNRKFCGWSNEGITRFNELNDAVMKHREAIQRNHGEGDYQTLAERYKKMLGVKRKNSRKRCRHMVPREGWKDGHAKG
jgi:hypothetical protein